MDPLKQKLVLPFEVKDVTVEGKFSGMASFYGEVDLGGDVMERGAFAKTLSDNPTIPILWQHKSDEVIGSGTLRNTREGLAVDATLDMDDPTAVKAHRKLKLGLMKGLSIGFNSIQDEVKNGIRHLKEVKLWEVSIVTFPALPSAAVLSVKQAILALKGDFNTELEAAETWAKRYQMISALDNALYSVIWGDRTDEEKIAAATESIEQISVAFLDFLPRYLALMDSRYKSAVETFEKKNGADLVAAHRAKIETETKQFQALLTKAAGGTLADPAAIPDVETGHHSALIQKFNEAKESFRWNRSNSN
jgi:HK97 family phage prohead protease